MTLQKIFCLRLSIEFFLKSRFYRMVFSPPMHCALSFSHRCTFCHLNQFIFQILHIYSLQIIENMKHSSLVAVLRQPAGRESLLPASTNEKLLLIDSKINYYSVLIHLHNIPSMCCMKHISPFLKSLSRTYTTYKHFEKIPSSYN